VLNSEMTCVGNRN